MIGFVAGALLGVLLFWLRQRFSAASYGKRAAQIVAAAEAQKEQIVKEAELASKDKLLALQEHHDLELREQRDRINAEEKKLRQKETQLERKSENFDKREREVKRRESAMDGTESRLKKLCDEAEAKVDAATRELEIVAGMSQEAARQKLIDALEDEARKSGAAQARRIHDEIVNAADEHATKTIAAAIQRLAGEYVAEKTVSVVELPSDEMKGRIIGREGRNIRAIETATGVDVIIDDTPGVVVVSAFSPVRREIAKLALLRLVQDGRIHPARIEEVVEAATQEIDQLMLRAGEQATFDLGLHGLHPELVKLVGRLKYRTINGQNMWNHAIETASIAGMMAAELGLNVPLAKRAGLLHDIGKAVDHEVEGSHAQVGAEQARRFGEKPQVLQAIAHHHDAHPPTVLGVLVQAADTLSKARPGVRQDLLETFIKRSEDLESISLAFKGVEKAYAISAGREVRVMVDYGMVSDDEAFLLSGDIARKISEELTYPGEVRVTVVREARATEIAR